MNILALVCVVFRRVNLQPSRLFMWKEVRGYAISAHPKKDTISLFLYCDGFFEPSEKGPGSWKDTDEYQVEFAPSVAAILIDILRNEKGVRFDTESQWIYSSRQESGVGELHPEASIFKKRP